MHLDEVFDAYAKCNIQIAENHLVYLENLEKRCRW